MKKLTKILPDMPFLGRKDCEECGGYGYLMRWDSEGIHWEDCPVCESDGENHDDTL